MVMRCDRQNQRDGCAESSKTHQVFGPAKKMDALWIPESAKPMPVMHDERIDTDTDKEKRSQYPIYPLTSVKLVHGVR